jgi:hypothetical protein
MAQVSVTAVCNRLHRREQHVCRWLLLSLDRQDSDTLNMTHDLIAKILGVRSHDLSHSFMALQRRGIIRYKSGCITVLDRPGLEQCVCDCYEAINLEVNRLLLNIQPGDPHHVLGKSMS